MCHLSMNQITLVLLYVFDSLKRTSSQESPACEIDYIGDTVCNQFTKNN